MVDGFSRGLCPPVSCGARAGLLLLANSGCFVSKCVLWCFVVFCGCFVMFCGCFAVFCECFAVFPQNTRNTRKTKNIEKHWKTRKTHNTLVYCGRFPRAKKFDCIAQNTFHKTSAKHRKTPQNTAKQFSNTVSQNAFCEITSQNTAKQNAKRSRPRLSQNGRETAAIRIARIRCYSSSKIRWICHASTQYAIYA